MMSKIAKFFAVALVALLLAACNGYYEAEVFGLAEDVDIEADIAVETDDCFVEAQEVKEEDAPVEFERGWLNTPYLVRLKPYIDGKYTDGMNVFAFAEDGAVEVLRYMGNDWFALNRPSPPLWEIDDIEALKDAANLASYETGFYWMDADTFPGLWQVIYADGGTFFLHMEPLAGGSGEWFAFRDGAVFVSANANGDFKDLGRGAIHIIWHDGYFYFVDLIEIRGTPGVGPIGRMDMNGENKTIIVDEVTLGPFQIANDRIFFSSLYDGAAYSVDLNGNDRQAVNEIISPRYHRPWLEFYGRAIINRAWLSSGYTVGTSLGSRPSGWSNPAIMCLDGCCLITFPNELRGMDPFAVIAWGNGFDEDDEMYELTSTIGHFVVLQSNFDDSLWVHHMRHQFHEIDGVFGYVREQLGER